MSSYDLIFTKKFPQRLCRHIFFWLTYYLFSLLTYFHPFLEKTSLKKWAIVEVVEVFSHILNQIIFCYVILYFLLPVFFNQKKYIAFIGGVVFLSIVVYSFSYFQQDTIFRNIHSYAGIPFLSPSLLRWYTFISFISYSPISTGLALAIKILKQFYVKQSENQLLSNENATAELQLLKAQVHPHFLFNTLNNIYSFTLDESLQAPLLVMNLSDTLHYMITDCNVDMVPLNKELKMIKNYIDLEKVRYGNRLNLKIEMTGNTEGKNIVPLLMIPFIENSFKHGSSQMLDDPWIELYVQADEDLLHFSLINNKPPQKNLTRKGGIGLNNVKKRLQLLYPKNHLLTVESTINTFTVNMQVPLQKSDNRNKLTEEKENDLLINYTIKDEK